MNTLIIDDDGVNSRPPTDEEWERFRELIRAESVREPSEVAFILSSGSFPALAVAFASAMAAAADTGAQVETLTVAAAPLPRVPLYRPIDERRAANPRAPIPDRIRRRSSRRY